MRTMLVAVTLLVAAGTLAFAPTATAKPCQELNGLDDFQCQLLTFQECEVAVGNHVAPGGHDYGGPDVVVDLSCLYP